jgi:hypothetical protein
MSELGKSGVHLRDMLTNECCRLVERLTRLAQRPCREDMHHLGIALVNDGRIEDLQAQGI